MGKRKSSRKVQKAPRPKLDRVFDCPFCNHNKTVEIMFKKQEHKASISCRVCTVSWETKTTALTEAIDVYSDWLDACEQVNSS
ncbi:hypothetical protein SteCoe_33362 [Stentor coeruleus]|uniref:Transcription elongation factor 1 homolog n=1 Tax=Stentor coeruleus TaxID=5963 RepID=A0A1R2AXC0_9CILI|nr:hypothetical protein SteCoe_33362 [Stentor coeruleus]